MAFNHAHRLAAAAGSVVALLALALLACGTADADTYDTVISHGLVMDPESGLDAVRNVGISGGRIRAISTDSLTGRQNIEARGLVVAPGFIDLHEHGQEPRNYQFRGCSMAESLAAFAPT